MDESFKMVFIANSRGEAETIKIFLESAGINAYINQESAGVSGYSMTVGMLAAVRIYVAADQYDLAVEQLEAMQKGEITADTLLVDKDDPDLEDKLDL